MNENDTARDVLQRLLVAHQPELGARLKQRMIAEYTREGIGHFDEKNLGFKKFKDYLLSVHGDIVHVSQGSTQGDIEVSLRNGGTQNTPSTSKTIRSAVWTAFSNPDPNRERYFHKSTGAVLHFLSGSSEKTQHAIDGGEYVQIHPLSADTQKGWMREFVGGPNHDGQFSELHDLIRARDYTSSLNSEFTKMLQSDGERWRKFRTDHIVRSILAWADNNDIPHDLLYTHPQKSQTIDRPSQKKAGLTARARAIHLLDALDEEIINQSIIPILVSSILLTRNNR